MGRVVTPTFRLEIETDSPRFRFSNQAWNVRSNNTAVPGSGQPTPDNIARWVRDFEASCQPGGCNSHVGITHITKARIIRQATDEVVAEWQRGHR